MFAVPLAALQPGGMWIPDPSLALTLDLRGERHCVLGIFIVTVTIWFSLRSRICGLQSSVLEFANLSLLV